MKNEAVIADFKLYIGDTVPVVMNLSKQSSTGVTNVLTTDTVVMTVRSPDGTVVINGIGEIGDTGNFAFPVATMPVGYAKLTYAVTVDDGSGVKTYAVGKIVFEEVPK